MKEYVTLKIDEIIPYDRNPRENDQAVDDVAESIVQCGYRAHIIVDENNVIIAGHTRLKALKKLGWKEVEVQRELDMTEAQKKKYRLLDNKVAEKADWNYDLLAWELEDVDFEGYDFGFDTEEEFDEIGLDSADEKNTVICTINCGAVDNYERIKERLQELTDEIEGSLSIKMQ